MFTPLSTGSERAQDRIWEQRSSPLSPRRRRSHPSPSRRVSRRRPRATSQAEEPTHWTSYFLRPSHAAVNRWLGNFWSRHAVLTLVPCLVVWVWVAMPFPVEDPYKGRPRWRFPGRHGNRTLTDVPIFSFNETTPGPRPPGPGLPGEELPTDVNFYFFLFWYFGVYVAVALFFITSLFGLYRLNWWPQSLGGKTTYTLMWALTLGVGWLSHDLDLFGMRRREHERGPRGEESFEWERKTFWVLLSFAAMHLPALACFSKLKRDRRHVYRHAQPLVQDTFFGNSLRRIPSSWLRFLWFMVCLAIASFSLIAGQAYASLFLSTLPHTSLDAGTWVWSWIITVQILALMSFYIISAKVRSRALLFVYKLFFQLVYHVFYRNLFARLRSPSQFATVQLLSSFAVIVLFPLQMTKGWHRILQLVVGSTDTWPEHVDSIAVGFYCRSLAQNTTMVSFLGWLAILHFGPNSAIYPFFRFNSTPVDPYTFAMTFYASLAVWGSELASSFVARRIMQKSFGVDVSEVGLDSMREYPELVPACGWASVHVSMNILMFLIKLNFR